VKSFFLLQLHERFTDGAEAVLMTRLAKQLIIVDEDETSLPPSGVHVDKVKPDEATIFGFILTQTSVRACF
jgi:hypothetical protein